jgi:hypothetical protein
MFELMSYIFLHLEKFNFTVACFTCQVLSNMQCVVVISASLVDRLSGATSTAIQYTANVYNLIQFYILTIVGNLWDPTD